MVIKWNEHYLQHLQIHMEKVFLKYFSLMLTKAAFIYSF